MHVTLALHLVAIIVRVTLGHSIELILGLQEEPSGPGGLLDLSDEELEQEIAKRQQPVDLSQLSDEDLQRELSKRQLAAGIVQNAVES